MFNLFRKNQAEPPVEPAIDYKKAHEEKYAKDKAAWIAANDKLKMVDAAYLGTKKNAFYGTYEEFLSDRHNKFFRNFAGMQQAPESDLYNRMNQQQMQNNAAGRYEIGNQPCGFIGGFIG